MILVTYLLVFFADCVEPLEDLPCVLGFHIIIDYCHVFLVLWSHIQLMASALTQINAKIPSSTLTVR